MMALSYQKQAAKSFSNPGNSTILTGMEENNIKHREIIFDEKHPDPRQANTAVLLLSDIPGVLEVQVISDTAIRIGYHLLEIDLQQIEEGLADAGFHLSGKLIYKLKRALYYFTEETERANKGCSETDPNSTRKVFIERYKQIRHGCRDDRPDHWRRYL